MEQSKITFESLSARLEKINQAEAITRVELGMLSREVLTFILGTEDVRIVNALVGKLDGKFVLTSNNRRVAAMFFREFLPFTDNGADVQKGAVLVFSKKKAKVWDKYVAKIEAWLADDNNNIWTWAEQEVSFEPKAKEYAGKITKLVEKSLKDEVEGISETLILEAVLAGGISVDALIALAIAIKEPALAA